MNPVDTLLLSLADDELILGHRDSEWTGHSPILEEDIAFSNIAQDEMGHALVWYSMLGSGKTPDWMAFERPWTDFVCCRFVTYPRGDFGYTVVRQFFFDLAETIRLESLAESSHAGIRESAGKILKEEAYHLMHTQGLVERLGDATDESHRRMQSAVDAAFPQSFGMFELLDCEDELHSGGVFPGGNQALRSEWFERIRPVLSSSGLVLPLEERVSPDLGGRAGKQGEHFRELVDDLQRVYRSVPGGTW